VPRVDRDTRDLIRQRVAIEQIAGLERSGPGWRGRCPLHDERTPSCVVTPGKGWRCFGVCDTGGDVIDLVQRLDGVGFREAVRRLAVRTGVYLDND
jgi:DNA primase